jgi:hypothetical protein
MKRGERKTHSRNVHLRYPREVGTVQITLIMLAVREVD